MGADAMTTPTPEPLKRCTACGQLKPAVVPVFYRHASTSDGLQTECRVCCLRRGRDARRRSKARRLANDVDLLVMAFAELDDESRERVVSEGWVTRPKPAPPVRDERADAIRAALAEVEEEDRAPRRRVRSGSTPLGGRRA